MKFTRKFMDGATTFAGLLIMAAALTTEDWIKIFWGTPEQRRWEWAKIAVAASSVIIGFFSHKKPSDTPTQPSAILPASTPIIDAHVGAVVTTTTTEVKPQ